MRLDGTVMQHVSRWDRGGNGEWDRSRYTAFWEGNGGSEMGEVCGGGIGRECGKERGFRERILVLRGGNRV